VTNGFLGAASSNFFRGRPAATSLGGELRASCHFPCELRIPRLAVDAFPALFKSRQTTVAREREASPPLLRHATRHGLFATCRVDTPPPPPASQELLPAFPRPSVKTLSFRLGWLLTGPRGRKCSFDYSSLRLAAGENLLLPYPLERNEAKRMNATRFQLPPLPQPHYRFDEIQPAKKDFAGSSLQLVKDRTVWQSCLGEMVLLCKEAVRRRRKNTGTYIPPTSSKPLSLEYLADRSDVDDPLWGYMLRDEDLRLQGFVTVTTFTNYHRSFRWDSLHPAAFEDDHHHGDDQQKNQQDGTPSKLNKNSDTSMAPPCARAVDSNGRLAQELQATIRAGDIWDEGIVWPRIAEISLLGGLGCGRTLISLVLEDLQHQKSSPLAHYDYVVLQATENSISFYESMGFIRVGALTTEANVAEAAGIASPRRQQQLNQQQEHHPQHHINDLVQQDWGSPMAAKKASQHATASPVQTPAAKSPSLPKTGLVVGPATEQYTTKRLGETVVKIAQSLRVNAQDIVFLNLRAFPDLTTTSRLKVNTVLTVPKIVPKETARQRPNVEIQWYTAKENDTPRSIAKMFHVPCAQIVAANKARLPGLLSSSRLKNGTRVRITKEEGACWQAYSHWAFPEDDFEEGEPSYMMALKLPKANSRKAYQPRRPVRESLAVEVSEFKRPETLRDVVEPPPKLDEHPPVPPVVQPPAAQVAQRDSLQALPPDMPPPPVPPKRPSAAFLLFCTDMRQRKASLLAGKNAGQASRILKDAYDLIPDAEKQAYIDKAANLRAQYAKAKAAYDKELALYLKEYPAAAPIVAPTTPAKRTTSSSSSTNGCLTTDTQMAVASPKMDLFNKVVRLKPGAPAADGGVLRYTYWYVLTYIPDLLWCHLAPMEAVGTFGADKPKAQGRPKYKLVDEALGMEVDISSTFCIPVKARSMRKTMDADKEEWDVRGSDETTVVRRASLDSTSVASFRSAIKPSVVPVDRKRKRSSAGQDDVSAVRPHNEKKVHITVRGGSGGKTSSASGTQLLRPPVRNLSLAGATASTTSTDSSSENYEDDVDGDSDDSTSDVVASSDSSSASSTNSTTNASPPPPPRLERISQRPKRLSAPSFLGESPISPRVRRQPVRGRSPVK
jgi:hypothetical protein